MSGHIRAQIIFYLGWIGMIVAETALWSFSGLALGIVLFTAGGYGWARYEVVRTRSHESLYGPVLWLISWLFRSWSHYPALVIATLIGGAPGVGLVLKQQSSPRAHSASMYAAFGYALFWAALHLLRPAAGMPFETWPSPPFL